MASWAAVGGGGGVGDAPAGGRWVHRPPTISSAIAAGTALRRSPTPPRAGSPDEGTAPSVNPAAMSPAPS